jgi:hypothetical protein
MQAALAPVREALRARAAADAGRVRAAAAEAAGVLDREARADVARWVAEARVRGEEDAALAAASMRAAADREARELILAARRRAYEELGRRVGGSARAVAGEPAFAGWRDRLGERARAELGRGAAVTVTPDGVAAEHDGRRVAWTLDALADRVVADLGTEVERLWAP